MSKSRSPIRTNGSDSATKSVGPSGSVRRRHSEPSDSKSEKNGNKLFLATYNKVLSMAKQALTLVKDKDKPTAKSKAKSQNGKGVHLLTLSPIGTQKSADGAELSPSTELRLWSKLLLKVRKAELVREEAARVAYQEYLEEKLKKADEEAKWVAVWNGKREKEATGEPGHQK